MAEVPNFSHNQKTAPAGFRLATCEMQDISGPLTIEGFIPDDEHYPAEAQRLSRNATRSSKYKEHGWNDALGIVLRTREVTKSQQTPFGAAHKTIRELHDAEKHPKESLNKIHFIVMNDTGEEINGETVFPMEYIVYTLSTNELKRYYFNKYTESIDEQSLAEAMELADQTCESVTGDRERMTFYATLMEMGGR